jgi:hypothetical protein
MKDCVQIEYFTSFFMHWFSLTFFPVARYSLTNIMLLMVFNTTRYLNSTVEKKESVLQFLSFFLNFLLFTTENGTEKDIKIYHALSPAVRS